VLRYAQFAKEHAELLRDAKPTAPVLVVFRAERVAAANNIMRDLLRSGIPFNVKVCGHWPLSDLKAKDVGGYRAVVASDVSWAERAGANRVYDSVAALLSAAGPEIRDFCRVQDEVKVVTRLFVKDRLMLVHLKQYGYDDQTDDVPELDPLTLMLHCPRKIRQVTCLSPDRTGSAALKFRQQGSQAKITVPTLEFHDLLVVELE